MTVAALLAVPGLPAVADSSPPNPADPATPPTVTADALPTVQINGVAWSQLIVGNTVYVAGQFTRARPAGAAAGVSETVRNNILAYNLTTGALITGFNANLNGTAYALAVAPDNSRIYVGGDFTQVGGVTRNRVAALNPTTGALITSFNPSPNGGVRAIQASGSRVFLGGSFTAISRSGVNTQRAKVAVVAAATGAVDTTWNPLVSTTPDSSAPTFVGRVNALQLSPTGDRIIIAGNFTHLNGSNRPGYGLGMVSTSGNARTNLAMNVNNVVRNAREDSSITSLASDGTFFYGTGYIFGTSGNLEGAFSGRWSDTNINWIEDCHGDSYGVYPSSATGAVYVVGHPHYCGNLNGAVGGPGFGNMPTGTAQRMIAFSKVATGRLRADTNGYPSFTNQPSPTLQNFYPQMDVGAFTGQKQAAWTVTGSGKYVVAGGEFPRVNGAGQQGLVRFATSDIAPNLRGPRLRDAAFPITLSTPAAGQVRINWTANYDYDNSQITYSIYRDGSTTAIASVTGLSTWYFRPAMTHTLIAQPSGSHSYQIKARDRFGRDVANSTRPSITVGAAVAAADTETTADAATGAVFAADTFGRTVTGGLGSANTGGQWSTYGSTAGFSVNGATASLNTTTAGRGMAAALNSATAPGADLTATTTLSKVPTGSNAYFGLIARRAGSSEYRAKVRVDTAGRVSISVARSVNGAETTLQTANVAGLVVASGQQLTVRVQAVGTSPTTVRAKVWASTSREPAAWQATVTDNTGALQARGSTGLFTYMAGSVSNLPIAVRFDDFRAATA